MEKKPKQVNDIEITEVDGDTMVYDTEAKKVHCLEGPASVVFAHCDGETTVEEITAKVQAQDPDLAQEDVEGVLNELLSSRLLTSKSWTRREVLARAAAVALVSTVLAPSPAAAQSGGTTPFPTTGTTPFPTTGTTPFPTTGTTPAPTPPPPTTV
jgi:hypothetical protein